MKRAAAVRGERTIATLSLQVQSLSDMPRGRQASFIRRGSIEVGASVWIGDARAYVRQGVLSLFAEGHQMTLVAHIKFRRCRRATWVRLLYRTRRPAMLQPRSVESGTKLGRRRANSDHQNRLLTTDVHRESLTITSSRPTIHLSSDASGATPAILTRAA